MTKVLRDEAIRISYNHLNLPHNFNFGAGKEIDIVYDATGMKLRKTVKISGTVQYSQDYVRGIEYRNDHIESIPISGGRLYNTSVNSSTTAVTPRYEYTITDHLGNARVMFTDKDNDGERAQVRHPKCLNNAVRRSTNPASHPSWDRSGCEVKYFPLENICGRVDFSSSGAANEILSESHYYPFGERVQRYKRKFFGLARKKVGEKIIR